MNNFIYYLLFLGLIFMSVSQPKFSKFLKKYYKFVPAGLVVLNNDTLSVQAFYMSSHEISNRNYSEFLNDLKKNNRSEDLEIARIQNENWSKNGNLHKAFAEHYHTHPAYSDYPVVNITHEAATLYCNWITEKLNQLPNKLGVQVKVRLPLHAEIIRAGVGENLGQSYPWKHAHVTNEKGDFLCNFRQILNSSEAKEDGQKPILGHIPMNSDNADILAPVNSYWPSEFGIYNLSGNAAEMINTPGISIGGSWRDLGHDVRLQSQQEYEGANIHIGFRVVVSWGMD